MFGSLRIAKHRLTAADRSAYRAHFCASCHALHAFGGRSTSLLTNYDQTVLTLVLAGLEGAVEAPWARCTAWPLRRVRVQALSPTAARLVAALNVAAVEAKLRDDVRDEGGLRLRARLGRRWLRGRMAKAQSCLAEHSGSARLGEALRDLDGRQAAVERGRHSTLAALARPSADVTGAIFAGAGRAVGRPELERPLRALGEGLGRFVYLWDAWVDRDADARRGRFNAVTACMGAAPNRDALRREFAHSLDVADHGRVALPLGEQGAIVAALLASLRTRVAAALPGEPRLREQRRAEAGDCDCGVCEMCTIGELCGSAEGGACLGSGEICCACPWGEKGTERRRKKRERKSAS
ncbi:MAG: DUF5685 family protein [Planctomycetota bacterium]